MMFKGKDRETLQSLTNNGTIALEHQKVPWEALDAIGTTIKAEEHFWDELLSDVCQPPNANSVMPKLRRCLKSWSCNMQCDTMRPETGSISRTSPSSPTYPPCAHCKLLKLHCEQYQKAKERG